MKIPDIKFVVHKFDSIEEAKSEDSEGWSWASDWNYKKYGKPSEVWQEDSYGGVTGLPGSLQTSEPVAEYIVTAANLFPDLVTHLEAVLSLFPRDMEDDKSGRSGFNNKTRITVNESRELLNRIKK